MKPPDPDNVGGVPPPRGNQASPGEGTRPTPPDDTSTGLPWPRAWGTVYLVVLGVFALWVGLLTALTAYSS
jgi:hypothetical protein